jgi:hypothetical protein
MRSELLAVLTRVRAAVMRWLAHNRLAATAAARENQESDALDACADVPVQVGLFDTLEGVAPAPRAITTSPRTPATIPSRSTGSIRTPPSPSAPTTTRRASAWSADFADV